MLIPALALLALALVAAAIGALAPAATTAAEKVIAAAYRWSRKRQRLRRLQQRVAAEAQAGQHADTPRAVHWSERDLHTVASGGTVRSGPPANACGNQHPSSRIRDIPSGFKPAKSGNGFARTLPMGGGWWVTCWVGPLEHTTRAKAKVFSPFRPEGGERLEAQEEPLMERVCSSEDEAFEWLRQLEADGKIKDEARGAIDLFESGAENDGGDDDIPF